MNITKHANERMQQRSIPPLIIEWLNEYGTRQHDHHGAIIHYFDKRSRRRLAKNVGSDVTRRLSDLLNAYMVKRDNDIITVGYRYKRINRH